MWIIRLCTVTVLQIKKNNATGINPLPSRSVLLLTSPEALTADYILSCLFILFSLCYTRASLLAQDTTAGGREGAAES